MFGNLNVESSFKAITKKEKRIGIDLA